MNGSKVTVKDKAQDVLYNKTESDCMKITSPGIHTKPIDNTVQVYQTLSQYCLQTTQVCFMLTQMSTLSLTRLRLNYIRLQCDLILTNVHYMLKKIKFYNSYTKTKRK